MSVTREKRDEYLVFGYVRNETKHCNIYFPVELMKICFVWYFQRSIQDLSYDTNDHWDEFDRDTMHDAYTFETENIVSRNDEGCHPYIFGTKLIDSGITIWRFKLLETLCYYIGIIDSSKVIKNQQNIESDKYNYHLVYNGGVNY